MRRGGRSNLEGEEMRRRGGRSGQEGEEKRRRKMNRAQCGRRRGNCMHEGWGEEKKRKKWPGR